MKIFVCSDLIDLYSDRGISCIPLSELMDEPSELTQEITIVDSELELDLGMVGIVCGRFKHVNILHTCPIETDKLSSHTNLSFSRLNDLDTLTTFTLEQSIANCSKLSNSVCTLSSKLVYLDNFLSAINSGSKDDIVKTFEDKFDNFQDIVFEINQELDSIACLREDKQSCEEQLAKLHSVISNLNSNYDKVVNNGKGLENLNNELTLQLNAKESELSKLSGDLAKCEDGINVATDKIREYIKTIKSLESRVSSCEESERKFKQSLEQSKRENNTLIETINSLNVVSKDYNVKVTDLAGVSKVIYIKYIDMLPYLLNTLRLYQKYTKGKKKITTGVCLVCDQQTTHFVQYSNNSNVVKDNCVLENCDSKFYILPGFSSMINKYIRECSCNIVFVVDLTFSTELFMECADMETIYTVNNAETLNSYNLNSTRCITQNAAIPNAIMLEYVEDNVTKGVSALIPVLNNTVFADFDKLWR